VAPVITAGQLTALGQRLGCANQAEFAEQLGITQGYLSHLLGGRRQMQDGPLHRLLLEMLRRHHLTEPGR
jgi:transcriptional regulator with XRE-family HTH domain